VLSHAKGECRTAHVVQQEVAVGKPATDIPTQQRLMLKHHPPPAGIEGAEPQHYITT